MKQKAVIISGIIGLAFGFLFAGTLGIDFFGTNENEVVVQEDLKKDEEGFRVAYNLTTSIYKPIYGSDVADKLDNDDTFILYIGRDTCPYCQQFVPELMTAAENQSITEIFHVDTIDPSNEDFVDDEGIRSTPTTYLIKNGVIVHAFIGYKTADDVELLLIEHLS